MKAIVAVLTSTFLMGSAYAQSPAASADAASSGSASSAAMMKTDATRTANVEKHIKALHATLKITPAEEPQWANVAQTMRGSAVELDKAIDKREANMGSASAVDDLSAYGDIAQAHADSVKRLAAAFSPLYAAMSDDQKKTADGVFAQRPHAHKKTAN
jgi:protein CpxP